MSLISIAACVLIIIAIIAIVIVIRRYRSQRSYTTEISRISMTECWETWVDNPELAEREKTLRDQLIEQLDKDTLAATYKDLQAFEARTLSGKYPLTAIRKELMDSVDRRMLNMEIMRLPENVRQQLRKQSADVIKSDEQARRYIAANEIRLQVLREFAAARYGDKAPNDWFTVYERASRLKQRNARAWIEHALTGDSAPGETERQQAINIVDNQLRMRLLQVSPGTQFPDTSKQGSKQEVLPGNRTLH
ncbi:MAG TPA: hypothetical protein VFP95_00345 [Gammaproteobacteria bacterium]|nr:hypothetical protein [Gammaproteobacteria bacterium]